MIPSVYIEIDSLPIQVTTGKIDRAKLPPPPLLRQSNDKDDGTVTPKIDFGGLTAVHCPLIEAVMEAMKVCPVPGLALVKILLRRLLTADRFPDLVRRDAQVEARHYG